jgi:excisionase family DNA binding protein
VEHEELLDLTEVATRLRRSVETVRRLIRADELPAVNVGGRDGGARYLVRESDLAEFIRGRGRAPVNP